MKSTVQPEDMMHNTHHTPHIGTSSPPKKMRCDCVKSFLLNARVRAASAPLDTKLLLAVVHCLLHNCWEISAEKLLWLFMLWTSMHLVYAPLFSYCKCNMCYVWSLVAVAGCHRASFALDTCTENRIVCWGKVTAEWMQTKKKLQTETNKDWQNKRKNESKWATLNNKNHFIQHTVTHFTEEKTQTSIGKK